MAQSALNTEPLDKEATDRLGGMAPPPIYSQQTSMMTTNRGRYTSLITIALRTATLLFSLIAFSVMVSATPDGISFKQFPAARFLVAMNVIVFVYSIAQLIHTIVVLVLRKPFPQSVVILATMSFACDQVFAFMLIAASAAATAIEDPFCNSGNPPTVFCSHFKAAIAMSYLAFVVSALAAVLSAHRLFHLT